MHLLAAEPGAINDGSHAVDLGQTPGDIIVLSAADTELSAIAQARAKLNGEDFPSLRPAPGWTAVVEDTRDGTVRHAVRGSGDWRVSPPYS